MKKRGFKFFGTTICYAHLQAVGWRERSTSSAASAGPVNNEASRRGGFQLPDLFSGPLHSGRFGLAETFKRLRRILHRSDPFGIADSERTDGLRFMFILRRSFLQAPEPLFRLLRTTQQQIAEIVRASGSLRREACRKYRSARAQSGSTPSPSR